MSSPPDKNIKSTQTTIYIIMAIITLIFIIGGLFSFSSLLEDYTDDAISGSVGSIINDFGNSSGC